MWSSASPLRITETWNSKEADIFVQYSTQRHGDDFPFDGEGGTLAHTFYPDSGELAGQVHIDDDEWWSHNTNRGKSSHREKVSM